MDNLQGILFIAAACWLALLLQIIGNIIGRASWLTLLGKLVQWQAFIIYLLGLALALAVVISNYGTPNFGVAIGIMALVTFLPLFGCSYLYWQVLRRFYRQRAASGDA